MVENDRNSYKKGTLENKTTNSTRQMRNSALTINQLLKPLHGGQKHLEMLNFWWQKLLKIGIFGAKGIKILTLVSLIIAHLRLFFFRKKITSS